MTKKRKGLAVTLQSVSKPMKKELINEQDNTSTVKNQREFNPLGFLQALHRPGDLFEIRALGCHGKSKSYAGWSNGVVSGYFNDFESAYRAVMMIEIYARPEAIYVTLNPVNPALLARANNRLIGNPKATTSDLDVLCYRNLLIDFDPVRPSGISATDDEMRCTLVLRDRVVATLPERGWTLPIIIGMSGNGAHAVYRLPDMPNTQESRTTIKRTLESLSFEFSTEKVKIDTAVFNPARISKILGTMTHKGDCIPERPHRRSYLEGRESHG